RRRLRPDRAAATGIAQVFRNAQAEFHIDPAMCFSISSARGEDVDLLTRKAGFDSGIVVPLAVRGGVLGTITLVASAPGRLFGDGDRALAESFAVLAARALESVRVLSRRSNATALPDGGDTRGGLGFLAPVLVHSELLPATVRETERLAEIVDKV